MQAMTHGINLFPKRVITGPTMSKKIAKTHGYFSRKMATVSKVASGHPVECLKVIVGLQ